VKAYIVRRDLHGTVFYLLLDGPYEYPVWTCVKEKATPMSFMQANANALAHGGDVRAT
jgi:hypothetical protein